MAYRYRLYVGISRFCTVGTVSNWFKDRMRNATIYFTTGIWQGKEEPSAVVEVITEKSFIEGMDLIGQMYKGDFEQEVVILTEEFVSMKLI